MNIIQCAGCPFAKGSRDFVCLRYKNPSYLKLKNIEKELERDKKETNKAIKKLFLR
jgi:hypothetical protein